MFPRRVHQLIALSGILGTILLGIYFGVGASIGLAQLPPTATEAQILSVATQYQNLWYLGTWLQATGSLLSVIFFLALVHQAGGTTRLSGVLTLLGSAVLLGVVLMEGVFTIDLAQAAADGHQASTVTSFDVMTVFIHIYPLAPAPLIFLALGTVLLGARLLPRPFAYLALGLGGLFELLGLVGLFTIAAVTLIPLVLQALWVVAAAIALLARSGKAAAPAAALAQTATPVQRQ
jgi:hypothetical protein